MNYQETIDYLFSQLPMYQNIGISAFKKDLEKSRIISSFLNHPENKFKSIHIAGTNGKGSISHALASILQEANYKVGLYTSPHLIDFRERIRLNGQMISEEYIIEFVEKYQKQFAVIQPSFFEWTVGLAFDYFANSKVDFAIIETGLGGRLDSTNIIQPILSVISNISFDHQAILGNTIEEIALEKAGIIKENIPVVIGESSGVRNIFEKTAKLKHAEISFAEDYQFAQYNFDLKGDYQKKNLQTILQTVKKIRETYPIDESSLKRGLNKVVENTGLRGRWEILGKQPLIICDTGHNEEGIKCVVNQLNKLEYNKLHFVFAVVKDKDINSILKLLPEKAKYYISAAKITRAMKGKELHQLMLASGLEAKEYNSIKLAIEAAKDSAVQDDLIFIGGSTFTVAEAIEIF